LNQKLGTEVITAQTVQGLSRGKTPPDGGNVGNSSVRKDDQNRPRSNDCNEETQ